MNSESKIGKILFITNSTSKNKKFEIDYHFILNKNFEMIYGSISDSSNDIKQGLIGSIGPFFYSNYYLENLNKFWMGNYYDKENANNNYVRLEYIFDNYIDNKQIPDGFNKIKGVIEGQTVYSGLTGLTLKENSTINISRSVKPINTFMGGLCFFFGLLYNEPLDDKFRLFVRGNIIEKDSIEINLIKKNIDNNIRRQINLKIGFNTNTNTIFKEFNGSKFLNNNHFHNIMICLSHSI